MGSEKIFIIIGAILSILGTYVFALFNLTLAWLGSGLGFALNLPDLLGNVAFYATILDVEVWMVYLIIIISIVFLGAGVLQLVGLKSRLAGLIFSLFPLGVGILTFLLFWTDTLEPINTIFAVFFTTDVLGNMFPIFAAGGGNNLFLGDLGLGAYFLVAGGTFGFIGCIFLRE